MHNRRFFSSPSSHLLTVVVFAGVTMFTAPLNAEPTPFSQETFLRTKQATVGILEDTQDQRTPEKPGKIVVRGTGISPSRWLRHYRQTCRGEARPIDRHHHSEACAHPHHTISMNSLPTSSETARSWTS